MKLIDGKQTAENIKLEIAAEVKQLLLTTKKTPCLAAIIVGSNPASVTYVKNKIAACEQVGFKSVLIQLNETISQEDLLIEIKKINEDCTINGYIVQLPLPNHICTDTIINSINPTKDVDGFHPLNLGKMILNQSTFISATPLGISTLLKKYKINTTGKHCIVIGRSNIVGTPISLLLSKNSEIGNCTVTLCHSKTENLKQHTLQADIIIAAIGIPHFLTADMVKQDVIVIDVGINKIKSSQTKSGFKIVGDVHFEEVSKKASYITPVPGGVGPMTIVSLIQNTLQAFKEN